MTESEALSRLFDAGQRIAYLEGCVTRQWAIEQAIQLGARDHVTAIRSAEAIYEYVAPQG